MSVIVAAGVASALVTRFGFKPIITVGMGLAGAGLLFFARLPVHGSYAADLLPGMVVTAFGLGFILVPLQIAAVSGVRQGELGLASGLINASRQMGGAVGLAVLSTIAATRFNNLVAAGHRRPGASASFGHLAATASARVDSYHYAFAACAVVLVAGLVLAVILLPAQRVTHHVHELAAA
jgi:hypothetical protein